MVKSEFLNWIYTVMKNKKKQKIEDEFAIAITIIQELLNAKTEADLDDLIEKTEKLIPKKAKK